MVESKKIVILGAGFGGLRAATTLAKKLRSLGLPDKYKVFLIDRNEHQTYTPLLYEAASNPGSTEKETVMYDIKHLTRNLGIEFIKDELESVDLINGDVHLKNKGEIFADFVVIALGSEINYFGILGLKENSLALKTFDDALKIQSAVYDKSRREDNKLRIAVGGAGATGVEIAGELKTHNPGATVTIIEALGTILPGLDKKVIALAEKRLKKLGVEIITSAKISSVVKNEIILENKSTTPFDILIWSGGVKAAGVLSKLPLHTEPRGRPVVSGGMECLPLTPDLQLRSRVYGLGDCVCFYDPKTQKPIPLVARAAISQADIVARNIFEEIKAVENKNYPLHTAHYLPKEYPYVIPIGGKWAVAKIGPFVISGFFGWILKELVELNYLLSIMPIGNALKIWLKGFSTFT